LVMVSKRRNYALSLAGALTSGSLWLAGCGTAAPVPAQPIRDTNHPDGRIGQVDPVQTAPAEDAVHAEVASEFPTYDSSQNNSSHPGWGSAGVQLLRTGQSEYADSISAPGGATRESPRLISNVIADQGDRDIISDRLLSAMIYTWGQFIDHDIGLTPQGG